MAVTSYLGNAGETLWKCSVASRSPVESSIRVQKAKFGFATQKEAEREAAKLLKECEREILLREAQGASWEQILEGWNKTIQKGDLSRAVKIDYIAAAARYTEQWLKRPASEINSFDVKELFHQLKAQGRSYGFIKKMKYMLGQIFVYGMEKRLIKGMERSPTFGVSIGKPEETRPEILTITEIKQLLSHARALNHPWYPHWAMALLTGMRSGELYALLWTDIDWDNNAITVSKSYNGRFDTITSTKAGYWRAVPISTELKSLLQEIKSQAGGRAHVLYRHGSWQQGLQAEELRRFCIGVGLPSVRFHTLRACFATQLIRNGVPPIQIQKICGWRDLKTMQRYIRMAGIEINGATETLRVLPEADVAAKVVNLFTGDPVRT